MLAGIEKAVQARKSFKVSSEKTAIETMLASLIDYAGLYPPASLDMRRAVDNYLAYRNGTFAYALGSFIVDVNRIDELCVVAANRLENLKLSVIVSSEPDRSRIAPFMERGVPIESVEMKLPDSHSIDQIRKSLPANLKVYIEVPIEGVNVASLDAIAAVGMRPKLRMGGVVPEAFPSVRAVADALTAVAASQLAFKATAGLHHPVRSPHRLTYAANSATGVMHGFVNLFCAGALIQFGGGAGAEQILEEQDPGAWDLTAETIGCRGHRWTRDQVAETRKKFLSFGSCSFEEPIRDLEAMGWL
jgi:hypothetical protein